MSEYYVIDCPSCGRINTDTPVNPGNRADRCICPNCHGVGKVINKAPIKVDEQKEDLASGGFQTASEIKRARRQA
jgi:hypothetical protein